MKRWSALFISFLGISFLASANLQAGEVQVAVAANFTGPMQQIAARLTDNEMRAVADYIQGLRK